MSVNAGEMSVKAGPVSVRAGVGELRKIPLILALALIVVCVMIELSSAAFLQVADAPGLGIPYLALVDGILAYTLGLMVLSLVVPPHLQAKLQGIVSVILAFFFVLGAIILIFVALAKLLLMVGLFFAFPFGTAAYFAIGWGSFPRGGAAAILSLLMLLKIGASICLPIAHQLFLKNKGLILLILTSLVAGIIVSFLHGIVPGPLVSITDALAAIIVGILALIWAIVVLIASIVGVVQALTTT